MFDVIGSGLLANLATIAAAVIAFLSLRALTRQIAANNEIAVWNAVAAHNRSITDNEARSIAVSIGFGIEQKNSKLALDLALTEADFDYWQMYWATRAVILSHVNLLIQIWLLAGEKADHFEERMNGWADLARTMYLQLYNLSDPDTGRPALEGKPDWYVDACLGMQLGRSDTAGGSSNWESYTRRIVKMKSVDLKAAARHRPTRLTLRGHLRRAFRSGRTF